MISQRSSGIGLVIHNKRKLQFQLASRTTIVNDSFNIIDGDMKESICLIACVTES